MNYLSPEFLQTNRYFSLVQPFKEGKRNLSICTGRKINKIEMIKHFAIGVLLIIPVINYLVLLILKAIHEPVLNNSHSVFQDQPFQNLRFEKSVLQLTDKSDYSFHLKNLADQFVKQLLEENQKNECAEKAVISLGAQNKILIKFDSHTVELSELASHINWSKIDEDQLGMNEEKIRYYLQNSLLFEKLRDHNPNDLENSPFNYPCPFVRLYTSYGFYSLINPLLRTGQLTTGLLPYASESTNKKLKQQDPDIITKVAVEILFISLMCAKSLNTLSSHYLANQRVIRIASIPTKIINQMQENEMICDRAFMSVSSGGGFAGGGPCDEESVRVKFIIHSKTGKHVHQFSQLPENEVLFNPCTKFKVLTKQATGQTSYKVEMEEVAE